MERRLRVAAALGLSLVGVVILLAFALGISWVWSSRRPDALTGGVASYACGDYATAAEVARAVLKRDPSRPEALRLLARSQGRLGKHVAARSLFERLAPETWEAEDLFLLAAGLDQSGRKDLARTALEKAAEKDPSHPDTLYVLARLDALNDDLDAAAARAERLSRVAGWEARGLVLVADLRRRLSDPAGAAEAFESALRIDPQLKGVSLTAHDAGIALARCRLELGQAERARSALEGLPENDRGPEVDWLFSRVLLQERRTSDATAALRAAGPGGRGGHTAPDAAAFVGAGRCVECHREIARAQRSSRHASTFLPPERAGEAVLPDRPTPDPHDPTVVHEPHRGDRPGFTTRRGDDVANAVVAYVLGSGRRAQTLLGRDDGGRFCELRLSRYQGTTWDLTTGIAPRPVMNDAQGYLGKPLSADGLRRCLDCHTTDFRAARDRVAPVGLDSAIGCERCHGPGGNHLLAVATGFPDPSIARPRLAPGAEITRLCAGCHSPRGPDLSPDAPASARFQASTMPWSRCYTESEGRLSCLTCHDPHRDAEVSPAFYETRCLGCHSASPPAVATSASHTRPASLPEGRRPVVCPVEPTRDCLRCHMPRVNASVPHITYADHHIRVHRTPPGSAGSGH